MIERNRRGRHRAAPATVVAAVLLLGACTAPADASVSVAAQAPTPQAEAIAKIVQDAMGAQSLRAVIVKVTRGDEVVTSQAFGPSLDGVPATTDMRFRNGAVVFAYLGTLLMLFVDEGKAALADTIDRWLPTLPEAGKVTLKMLANQTSGYPDYETDPGWNAAFNADPFQSWTVERRLKYAFSRPVQFAPGTNWSYSHTNFMLLGEILAKIGGKPLDVLLRERVLEPMGLSDTVAAQTGAIPSPVLHSFSSERREALGVPPKTAFYEESTFWNSDWGTPPGANQTSTIDDLATTAIAVGTGKLLSKASYQAMTDTNLLGFGQAQADCAPSCFKQVDGYNFGLGVIRSGAWIMQNPLVGGYSATEAYLPQEKVGISVVTTFLPGAFDCKGDYPDASDHVFRLIGAYVAPDYAPPMPKPFAKAC
ncbi:serine hydrolase domain-containing protein [Catellatospora sichuanensis]|uniref:serine hydrolase domain-containing protein n=1 Tax=Catellatospora sichuanensis TaxID=1969805 RepID=UPI001C8FBBF6|nr:serine hydrolase domain-containing protein [Catellatospora sichuanensis]